MPEQRKIAYPGYLVDAAERVAWTLAEVVAGAGIDYLATGEITWRAGLFAVFAAVAKVAAAKKIGPAENARIGGDPDDA